MTYIPDFWAVIKINGEDPHYRVFGSWAGSYTSGESWRMNSGIVRVEQDENPDFLRFIGSSGSVYQCHKDCYGFHWYGRSVFNNYVEQNPGKMEEMPEDTDWFNMNWIIT